MLQEAPQQSRVKVLNPLIQNECIVNEVYCLRLSRTKNMLFWIMVVATLGFVWLLSYWSRKLSRKLRYKFCAVDDSTHFLLYEWDDVWEIVRRQEKVTIDQNGQTYCAISFNNRYITYYYDTEKQVFSTARYGLGQILDSLMSGKVPIHPDIQRAQLRQTFGRNIIELPVGSKMKLFFAEVLSPFQVFQFYAIVLWYWEAYYILPTVLIIASLITYYYNVQLLHQTLTKLKQDSDIRAWVGLAITNGEEVLIENVSSQHLVPGDFFFLGQGDKSPCDCIILMGSALINENYITGDPYPVRKIQLQNFTYNPIHQNQTTIYMGTQIIEVDPTGTNRVNLNAQAPSKKLLCLCTRTNYYSLRGQYLRSIIFSKPHSNQFYNQSIKFLIILFAITLIGYTFLCLKVGKYFPTGSMIVTLLDLITTAIPPSLPTAMSVGIGLAIQNLKRLKINCTRPQKILLGGEVNTVCFQKTGTLTKKDVRVIGLAVCQSGRISKVMTTPNQIGENRTAMAAYQAMSTCHSVSKSSTSVNLGKPIDTAMLQFSTGKIISNNQVSLFDKQYNIVRRMEFTSQLQRMAVMVSDIQGRLRLFVKGDPQKVTAHCMPQTIPHGIGQYISRQSEKGYKVIAISARGLDAQQRQYSFKKLQKDMVFIGVLIFQNALQTYAQQTVRDLLRSKVQVILLSGDSQLTLGSVAFDCGMLDGTDLIFCDLQSDLKGQKRIVMRSKSQPQTRRFVSNLQILQSNRATSVQGLNPDEQFIREFLFNTEQRSDIVYGMTGRLFQQLFMKRNMNSLKPIFNKTILFSRMLPRHKVGLFHYFQQIRQSVAYVGQRSRQLSSFQHADLSLALTDGEVPSLAHFSSNRLSSILDLLRVCRASLSCNFQTFKMLCQFSLMQFTTLVILYVHYEQLTKWQNLYIDLFIMCPIFITLGMTEPCDRLSKFPPPASLFSAFNLLSMLGLFFIQLIGQIFIVQSLKGQNFYNVNQHKKLQTLIQNGYIDGGLLSSTLFIFTNFLYMGVVVATSISKPFRKDFYTNPYLVANVLILTAVNFFMPFATDLLPSNLGIDSSVTDWYVLVVFWAQIFCLAMYIYQRVLVWFMEKFHWRGSSR